MENQARAPPQPSPAATDNPYGLEALVTHGDAVSYTVLGILLIMSLVSWYIIFTKLWDQYRLGKSVRRREEVLVRRLGEEGARPPAEGR